MKIIKINLKNKELFVEIENLDDIWVLSQIIEPEDLIKGKTERKIKIGGSDDRNIKVIRKTVFLTIKAEKIEISEQTKSLRVLGVIIDGNEEVPRGEHHSFVIEPGTKISIIKKQLLKYQLERVKEATKTNNLNIIAIVFDREEALIAKLKSRGYELISHIKGDVSKKEEKHVSKGELYQEIIDILKEIISREKTDYVIVASQGFWKEKLLKLLPEEIKKISVSATVSHTNQTAFNELMKRGELKKILENNTEAKELKLIDELLKNISKDLACYGFKETKQKVEEGAVKELIISFSTMQEYKEQNKYLELENIMIQCEKMDGKINIISSEQGEKILKSLSGIAGILRWKN